MSRHDRRAKRARPKRPSGLPKGAYRVPSGDYVVQSIGSPDKRGRQLRIKAIHRTEPDAAKVAEALIALAIDRAHNQNHQA